MIRIAQTTKTFNAVLILPVAAKVMKDMPKPKLIGNIKASNGSADILSSRVDPAKKHNH